MEFFKTKTTFDFLRFRQMAAMASTAAILGTIVSLFVPGLNLGVDFAGGTEVEIQLDKGVTAEELRGTLAEVGHKNTEIVAVQGEPGRYVIRVKDDAALSEQRAKELEAQVRKSLSAQGVVELRVSPSADRVTVTTGQPIEPSELQAALAATGRKVLSVTAVGSANESRYTASLAGTGDALVEALQAKLGDRAPESALRVEWVGPKAGKQLRDGAIKAALYTMALIMVYVAFRFDLRFAPGAIVALFHDAVIVIGMYALTRKEFTLGTVAAILTIIGYSINDTIVIFDRVRENLARSRDASLASILNLSLNETLSRTIITSSVTLISVLGLLVWGTPVVKDIAFALVVGFVSGTYSTIYIAAPLVDWMDRKVFRRAVA